MNSIEVSYPYRLRGPSLQQSDTGVLWLTPQMRSQGFLERLNGMALRSFALQNRSGTTGVHGIGVRIPNRFWIAGQWVDAAGTPYTDDTVDAQDLGAADFPLETTTNSDGYVVASRVPFNAVSIDVGTASATGSPVRAVRYSNTAGDGWTAMTNLYIQDGAASHLAATGTTAANEALVVFNPPADWGKIAAAGLSGIPGGYYAINVRATTAPTGTAAVADAIEICRLYEILEGIAHLATHHGDYTGEEMLMAWDVTEGYYGDALVALFETANAGNRVTARVRAI